MLSDAGKSERDAPAAINKWMEKKVAHYKQLRGGIKLVDSVPKSPSGKLLRRSECDRDCFDPPDTSVPDRLLRV